MTVFCAKNNPLFPKASEVRRFALQVVDFKSGKKGTIAEAASRRGCETFDLTLTQSL